MLSCSPGTKLQNRSEIFDETSEILYVTFQYYPVLFIEHRKISGD